MIGYDFYTEKMSYKQRKSLPDDIFGIPELRKYPLNDKKHVLSAIKLFNHVESKYEKQLAYAIIKKMIEYNIDFKIVGKKNRLNKYQSYYYKLAKI